MLQVLPHVRDQYREDEKPPDHIVLGVAGDVGQTHAVAKVQDHKQREADADQVALAAENADPSQKHGGDDVELEALRHVAAHGPESRGVEHARQRRHESRADEQSSP